jgi:PEP-CTERM motif
MEHTNYVARAKALMMKTARTTALVIVPLAAAVSAHAGAILPTSNLTCSATDGFGSTSNCTSSVGESQFAALGGIQGISFFTTSGSIGFSSSGGGTDSITLKIGAGGTLTGNLTQNDPVAFAFSFNLPSGGSLLNWSINMAFGTAFGNCNYACSTITGGAASGSFFPESGSMTIPITIPFPSGIASGSAFWETATISAQVSGASFVQINIPSAATLDFNSVAASSVPEPGSVGLMGSGLAFLGYLFRRRRRKA